MNLQTKAALLVSGLVLVVAPAVALGAKPAPGSASTPAASQYPKGHAYGFFCTAESKTTGSTLRCMGSGSDPALNAP